MTVRGSSDDSPGPGVVGVLAWGGVFGVVGAIIAFLLDAAWWGFAIAYVLAGSAGVFAASLVYMMRTRTTASGAKRSEASAERAPT